MLLLLLPLALLFLTIKNGLCLNCIQCDRQMTWYAPEENERHIIRCQTGLIPATRCTNASHTHCIFNYYKKAGTVTVTERRCGMAEEMTGCTLYKSVAGSRTRRHLIGGSNVDNRPLPSSHRRRETSLLVEVCTSGCSKDGCINAAHRHTTLWLWLLVLPAVLVRRGWIG